MNPQPGRPTEISSEASFQDQVRAARRNRELINRLAQWRASKGVSQAEVARGMHTSQPAVARIESHQHDAQMSTLGRYVTALGLSLGLVLTDPATGARVWSSEEEEKEPEYRRVAEEAEPAQTWHTDRQEMPGLVVIAGNWDEVSEPDLERHPCLIVASKEPGWSLIYLRGPHDFSGANDDMLTWRGADSSGESRVRGLFTLEDPDPVAISVCDEFSGSPTGVLHVLTVKVKDPGIAEFREHRPVAFKFGGLVTVPDQLPSARAEVRASGRVMNKRELADAISDRVGGKKSAAVAIDAVIDTIQLAVAKGEKVAISGFGIFETSARQRPGIRNPATGGIRKARRVKVPIFRPGADFRDIVNTSKRTGRDVSKSE